MGRSKLKRCGDRETRRLAHEALRRKEKKFIEKFGAAGDRELLNYLAYCAEELGFGPRPQDVLGARFIQKRFNGWEPALSRVGLAVTPSTERTDRSSLFSREVKKQEELRRRIAAALAKNEKDFAIRHKNDGDEEIFAYVRTWAERLKRAPDWSEILGGLYIRERFNNDWRNVLRASGLPPQPDYVPKLYKRLVYMDEANVQLDAYVDESMREIEEIMKTRKAPNLQPVE